MKKTNSKKELRDFGLLIGIGFPIILGWIIPSFFGHGIRTWTFWIGIPILIIGIIYPTLLKYPYKLWMRIGEILGWINSHIILSLVYITILLPIAFFMRLFSYDPLKRKGNNLPTYREEKSNRTIDLNRIF